MATQHVTHALLWLTYFQSCVQRGDAVLYQTLHNYTLQSCTLTQGGVGSVTSCAALCSLTVLCVSGSHVPATGQCCLSDRYLYQPGANFARHTQAVYFQQNQVYSPDGRWLMVFRAVSGNGHSVHDAFLNTGTYHDSPLGGAVPVTCWSTSASGPCSHHIRSKLLDLWANGTISPLKVKLALYKEGAEVMYILFDGVGSNLTSWFHPHRVTSSTYTDLDAAQQYFFFSHLYVDPLVNRSFYVAKSHNGCSDDWGWLSVVERGVCLYEAGVLPLFIYSQQSTYTRWDGPGKADVLAVYLEL